MNGIILKHNNACVKSNCPICGETFKPPIGECMFLADRPLCSKCSDR